jgi:hypothetical protein
VSASADAQHGPADEDVFRITTATLTRHFRGQAAFVVDGIGPDTGIASVLAMAHLLDRLDALDSSPAREATREATRSTDHAALALLAVRTLTLPAATSDAASSPSPIPPPPPTPPRPRRNCPRSTTQSASDQETALRGLRAWFDEWSEIAKACIKRRDHPSPLVWPRAAPVPRHDRRPMRSLIARRGLPSTLTHRSAALDPSNSPK